MVFYQSTTVDSTKNNVEEIQGYIEQEESDWTSSVKCWAWFHAIRLQGLYLRYISGVYCRATAIWVVENIIKAVSYLMCADSKHTPPLTPTYPRPSCETNLMVLVLGEGKTFVFSVSTSVSQTESLRKIGAVGYNFSTPSRYELQTRKMVPPKNCQGGSWQWWWNK